MNTFSCMSNKCSIHWLLLPSQPKKGEDPLYCLSCCQWATLTNKSINASLLRWSKFQLMPHFTLATPSRIWLPIRHTTPSLAVCFNPVCPTPATSKQWEPFHWFRKAHYKWKYSNGINNRLFGEDLELLHTILLWNSPSASLQGSELGG